MSAALPDPLTPADCDLHDFRFMPLDVQRLRDSDLAALESPEACWAAVLLWCASWHQVPAASLPSDDRLLSRIAGYQRAPREWERVKAGALRGWVNCTDGRLYHPVVAEKAREAWQSKLRQRWDTECARIRKANQRNNTSNPLPSFEEWLSSRTRKTVPQDMPTVSQETPSDVPLDNAAMSQGTLGVCPSNVPLETSSKGQGEGQGQGQGDKERFLGASPKPSKRDRPRARIPSDWQPDDGGKTYAGERGVLLEREVSAFRNHHAAKGSLMADWPAAWRTWCDNAVKYGHAPGRRVPVSASDPSEANPLGRRVTPMSGSF